jgi:hypothetical protein
MEASIPLLISVSHLTPFSWPTAIPLTRTVQTKIIINFFIFLFLKSSKETQNNIHGTSIEQQFPITAKNNAKKVLIEPESQ